MEESGSSEDSKLGPNQSGADEAMREQDVLNEA